MQDVVRANRDKEYHEWQQDIESAIQYISAYTKIGDTVIDPFLGGGTTAVACKKTNRKFIGFDINDDFVKASKVRIFNNDWSITSSSRTGLEP